MSRADTGANTELKQAQDEVISVQNARLTGSGFLPEQNAIKHILARLAGMPQTRNLAPVILGRVNEFLEKETKPGTRNVLYQFRALDGGKVILREFFLIEAGTAATKARQGECYVCYGGNRLPKINGRRQARDKYVTGRQGGLTYQENDISEQGRVRPYLASIYVDYPSGPSDNHRNTKYFDRYKNWFWKNAVILDIMVGDYP